VPAGFPSHLPSSGQKHRRPRGSTSQPAIGYSNARRRTVIGEAVMTVDERVVQRMEALGLIVLAPIAPRSLALAR
jgi:hypothetical protein